MSNSGKAKSTEPAQGKPNATLDVFRMRKPELIELATPEAMAELERRRVKRAAKRRARLVGRSTEQRARAMHAVYQKGATLGEVADEFGVSRERVRQLFKQLGFRTRSVAEAQALRRNAELAREDEIVAAYERLGDQKAVALELGVTQKCVGDVLSQAGHTRKHARRRPARKRYSDDELLNCLREASESLGGILTVADYRAYASGRKLSRGRLWPTNQTFQLRFGSWRGALLAAGLRSNPPSAIAGQRLFDEAHCIDALRHAARELGRVPTSNAYEKLARESQGALPSQATVRHRLGTWHEALRKAGL